MTKRFRSLVIALVALALSAGVVFAAHSMPTVASNGLTTAGTHAAKTVPVEPDKGDRAGDDQAKPDTADTADKDDQAKPDTADTTTHPDNHGKLVSEAAQLTTPAGFRNHGAYVSSIARGDHGSAGKGHGEAPKPPTTPTTTH